MCHNQLEIPSMFQNIIIDASLAKILYASRKKSVKNILDKLNKMTNKCANKYIIIYYVMVNQKELYNLHKPRLCEYSVMFVQLEC